MDRDLAIRTMTFLVVSVLGFVVTYGLIAFIMAPIGLDDNGEVARRVWSLFVGVVLASFYDLEIKSRNR